MKKISAEEFISRTKKNPNWCSEIKSKLVVKDYLDLRFCNIQSLSPLLIFEGENPKGLSVNLSQSKTIKSISGTFLSGLDASFSSTEKLGKITVKGQANFAHCKDLTSAKGTYHNTVNFSYSGIKSIGNILSKHSAIFHNCKNLTIAEGTFYNEVQFDHSAIKKIGNLNIYTLCPIKTFVSFRNCENLSIPEGIFPGYVTFESSNVIETKNLIVLGKNHLNISANFLNCKNLKKIRGEFSGEILAPPHILKEFQTHKTLLNYQITKLEIRKNSNPFHVYI